MITMPSYARLLPTRVYADVDLTQPMAALAGDVIILYDSNGLAYRRYVVNVIEPRIEGWVDTKKLREAL